MDPRQRERIIERCERFVAAWSAPRDPAAEFRVLADRAGARLDVYGGGESVERLEARVAELLGKEAAALFPSGTMAQQIALRIWCERRGCSTVAFHSQCHLDVHEERGYAHLHGLHARPVGPRDRLIVRADLDEVKEPVGALLLELPQRDLGGSCPRGASFARRRGGPARTASRCISTAPASGSAARFIGGLSARSPACSTPCTSRSTRISVGSAAACSPARTT